MVCKGHCEIDKFADRSYRAVHDVKEDEWYGEDITKTNPADLPRVNLWAGGFPCQDISVSGRQRGLAGKRSSLFFEIVRLLKGTPTEDRPEWLVLENVKNLLSVNRGWDFATVLNSLAEIGYHIEYGLLNARRLGDKDFWRDQGVYIKRQEFGRPIKIVESNGEYTRDDGSIGVSYNIKRVYDISQTTARTRAPQAASHDARALLNALIYKRPAPVQSVDELPNGMDAVYDREQNAVFVRRGLSANDLFCGLSKALAQAELARTGEEYTEENAGFKAHCVSYILGKEFGVEVSSYAFEAPADFLRTDDPQTIRAELTDIRDTAYDISARMMRSLEQSKAPRQSEQER